MSTWQGANEVGMGSSPGSPAAFSEGEEETEDGSGGVGEGTGKGGVTRYSIVGLELGFRALTHW